MRTTRIDKKDINFKMDLYVQAIDRNEVNNKIHKDDLEGFTKFYKVYNCVEREYFNLAKGHKDAKNQIVAFYPNGKMNIGYGFNFKNTIKDAIAEAMMYI